MKRYILLFGGILMLSNASCFGATLSCSGGSVITGTNGTPRLCLSDQPMTWYAAHSWCAANNGKLVLEATVNNRVMRNSSTTHQWGFVNRVNGSTVSRVNLYNSNNNGGRVGTTSTINRAVGNSTSGESNSNGSIKDMYALCQPLSDSDTY